MDTGISIGCTALDTATGKTGRVMGLSPGKTRYYMRPLGGGCEWTASPSHIQRLPENATPTVQAATQ